MKNAAGIHNLIRLLIALCIVKSSLLRILPNACLLSILSSKSTNRIKAMVSNKDSSVVHVGSAGDSDVLLIEQKNTGGTHINE